MLIKTIDGEIEIPHLNDATEKTPLAYAKMYAAAGWTYGITLYAFTDKAFESVDYDALSVHDALYRFKSLTEARDFQKENE